MPETILRTKLYIPPPRPNLVPRPRLLDQLNQALSAGSKLTLVSAPAGFGKTTLLSAWISGIGRPAAWISLDEGDNEPGRFWRYLITAVREIDPRRLDSIDANQLPSSDQFLPRLINDIYYYPEPFLLVLDDFHVINNQPIHDGLAYLLDNLPPQMHLVLASRIDPSWPMARMRGRGELVEIRSADLRFTTGETAKFLNDIMALDLSPSDITALDARTEGWIAGLQMAALSMSGQPDVSSFIKTFSGSNRFILDYLVEEVLNQQPVTTREFLLKSAILRRITAPLCDVLLETNNSQEILIQLERNNLFLVPMDDKRRWYRYHHLFGDLLQNRVGHFYPDQANELHRRAAKWFEGAGFVEEAIPHALDGEDFDRAARLMESLAAEVINLNKERLFAGWLDRLPKELIQKRPWLAVNRARVNWSDAEESFEWIEETLSKSPDTYSAAEKKKLEAFMATLRCHLSLVEGDVSSAMVEAEKALASLPPGESPDARLLIALGGISWAKGETAAAEDYYAQGVEASKEKNQGQFASACLCYLGLLKTKQGQLQAARGHYQAALEAAVRPSGEQMPVSVFPMARMGDLLREWNDLTKAAEYLIPAFKNAAGTGYHDIVVDAYGSMARLHLARHEWDDAFQGIQETQDLIDTRPADPFLIGWADECLMRLLVRRGELDTAVHLMEKRGLTPESPLSYHHDLHHLNLARLLTAQGGENLDKAQKLLSRLLQATAKAGWVHETIKVRILQAMAFWKTGNREKAAEHLTLALTLAEPGGYIRLFVDEGAIMADILSQVQNSSRFAGQKTNQTITNYAQKLLAAFGKKDGFTSTKTTSISLSVVEPLSEREEEILRLLTTHLSSTEIAAELTISPNTVRFHIKNIYNKLNVHNRSEAVQAACQLSLV